MTSKFAAAMRRAAGAPRVFNVMGATRIIQKALGTTLLSRLATFSGGPPAATHTARKSGTESKATSQGATDKVARMPASVSARAPKRLRRPLGEVLETLRKPASSFLPGLNIRSPRQSLPVGAQFTARSFTSNAGSRAYKLYIPASSDKKPKGLIVMLHGCTQNPDDFAAGTNMNAFAEMHGLLIAYPAQTGSDNAASCWNWFETGHQLRDAGEPSILAGITSKLIKEFSIRPDKVFVAGLSAGAAMAVIMGKAYPELFHAVGVHSGLAYQSAGNVMSAMAVMRGKAGSGLFAKQQSAQASDKQVRTIVFQGAADRTVHPSNAERIFETAAGEAVKTKRKTISGSTNGRSYRQTIIATANGESFAEHWLIAGAGHAWSGGSPSGTYADPKGPDASAEMVRFFLNGK